VKPEIKSIRQNFLSLEIKILVNLYNIIPLKQKKIIEAIIEKVSFLAQNSSCQVETVFFNKILDPETKAIKTVCKIYFSSS